MPLEVKCPNPKCGCLLKADTLSEGKELPCPKCGTMVAIPDVSKDATAVMDQPADDPMIGKKLAHYEITAKLGSGGMGTVYKARNISLDKEVALKVLSEGLSRSNRELVGRFVREARAAAKLDHPNIAAVYFAGRVGDHCFIEMQYLEGKSLDEILSQKKRLGAAVATKVVEQVAQALKAAHSSGIIHRDIKPSNIILDRHGRPKVTDFGLAKITETETKMTTTGQVIGTPDFMSPEQCRGVETDQRSDIYSLGATYYKLITGETPFDGKTVMQVLLQHMDTPPPSPKDKVPDVPESVCAIIAKMLAKKPEDRYQNCDELIADLRKAIPTQVAQAPTQMPEKRSRAAFYGIAAVVAIAGIGAAVFLVIRPDLFTKKPQPLPHESLSAGKLPPAPSKPMGKSASSAPVTPSPPEPTPGKKGPKPNTVEKPGAQTAPSLPANAATQNATAPPPGKAPEIAPKENPVAPQPIVIEPVIEKASFDAKAFAKDTEDVNGLIDNFEFERAHIRLQTLIGKYPKEAQLEADNVKRLDQFVRGAFGRLASGEVQVKMKDFSRRYAYVGDITKLDMEGVTALKGKFEKKWKDFDKQEIYQLLTKCVGGKPTPADRVALALFLAAGTTNEESLRLAEDEIGRAGEKGMDTDEAIAAIGLARQILSAKAAPPEKKPIEQDSPVEKLAVQNRPMAGRLLLYEKFTDNKQLWQQTEDANNRCMVENGVYHLRSSQVGPTRLRGTVIPHTDCILHASVTVVALDEAAKSYFGLCVRRGKTGPFYLFRIAPALCGLTKIVPDDKGNPTLNTLCKNENMTAADFIGKTVQMEILAQGPFLRCFVNGEMILEATDPQPSLAGERIDICLAGSLELMVDEVVMFALSPNAAQQAPRRAGGSDVAGKEHEKIIQEQTELRKEIETKLGLQLATVDTEHFLVHGDLPKTQLGKTAKAGEKVYTELSHMFRVNKKQELWPGKYLALVFKDKQEFADCSTKVFHAKEQIPEEVVSSPLAWKYGTVGFVTSSPPGSPDDLAETYYWYLSAHFLSSYKEGKPLPTWLVMGFREYCKKVMASNTAETEHARAEAKALLKSGDRRSLSTIQTGRFSPSDKAGRTLCFSLVDYAISQDAKRFVRFVETLKSGADEETAFKEAFEKTGKEFEAGWMAYVERKY